MGLADRDYMRERARDRASQRNYRESMGAGWSGHRRKQSPLRTIGIIAGCMVGGLLLAYGSDVPIDGTPPSTPAKAAAAVAENSTATAPGTSMTQPQTTSQSTETVTVVRPPMPTAPAPDQRELVPILNGSRTQDLSHVTASTVGDTQGYFPANGAVEWFVPIDQGHATGRLTVLDQDRTDTAKLLRIRQAESGIVIVQLYLQTGQGAYVDLPLGNYTMTVAKGNRWYGRPRYFGPEGAYLNALQLIQITPQGTTNRLLPYGGEGRPMMAQPTYSF